MYTGDFVQLPPVKPPTHVYKIAGRSSANDDIGHHIWHMTLNTVILLERNHRNVAADPDIERLTMLQRAVRTGPLSEEMRDLLNTRVITNPDNTSLPPLGTLIAFDRNIDVMAANYLMTHRLAVAKGLDVIRLYAHIAPARRHGGQPLPRDHPVYRQYVANETVGSDGLKDGPLTILDFYVGAPILFTAIKNNLLHHSISNNASGTIVGLHPPTEFLAPIPITLPNNSNSFVRLPSIQPTHMLIRVNPEPGNEFHLDGLPPNVYPLPIKRHTGMHIAQHPATMSKISPQVSKTHS